MEQVNFSRPVSEIGCIIGHLFDGMEPPCSATPLKGDWLTICFTNEMTMRHYYLGTGDCTTEIIFSGPTKGGGHAEVKIAKDRCEYRGGPAELQAILEGKCPDRRCGHG